MIHRKHPAKAKHFISNIQVEAMVADCEKYGPGVRIVRRNRTTTGDNGFRCRVGRKLNKHTVKYASQLVTACEVCGTTENLYADVRRVDQKFRGTLCRTCNVGVGMFKDDPVLLAKAIDYLNRMDLSFNGRTHT